MAENASAPAVALEAVTLSYGLGSGAVHALRGVTVCLPAAEFVLVTGPSGSGKTSLLSVVGCLVRPRSGTVRLRGQDITLLDDNERALFRRNNVGFVFQHHRLLRHLSVLENVLVAADLVDGLRPEVEERALALLSELELAHKAASKPHELSGGQRQRVAVARAILRRPRFVLADEPTASLDSKCGLDLARLLRGLVNADCSVMVVSHDQRLREFADLTIELVDGLLSSSPALVGEA